MLELFRVASILQPACVVRGSDSLWLVSMMRREVQTHDGPDQPVVRLAFGTSPGAGHMYVSDVALAYDDEVSQVPS